MKEALNSIVKLREHGKINDSDIVKLLQGRMMLRTSSGVVGTPCDGNVLKLEDGTVVSYSPNRVVGLVEAEASEPEPEASEPEAEDTEPKSLGF